MFPLDSSSLLILLLVASSVLVAVAVLRVGWSKRVGVTFLAAVLPFGAFLYDPPRGEFALLSYFFAVPFVCAALVAGALIGFGLRFLPSHWGAPLLAVSAIAVGGFELGRQYVPPSCAAGPLPVRIGGATLAIPTEMQPILFDPSYHTYLGFGDGGRKLEYARLCRMTSNGAEPVAARTVELAPLRHLSRLQTVCAENTPPDWCAAFSAEAYGGLGRIEIASTKGQPRPHGYWDSERLAVVQQGNVDDGTLCTLSEGGRAKRCWLWKPIGPEGHRLMVASRHLDDGDAQSVDQVLGALTEANRMVRTILGE